MPLLKLGLKQSSEIKLNFKSVYIDKKFKRAPLNNTAKVSKDSTKLYDEPVSKSIFKKPVVSSSMKTFLISNEPDKSKKITTTTTISIKPKSNNVSTTNLYLLKTKSQKNLFDNSNIRTEKQLDYKIKLDFKTNRTTRTTTKKPYKRITRQTNNSVNCEPNQDINDYVDRLFRIASGMERKAPNITLEFPEYNIEVFLYNGFITRLNKLKRVKEVWSFCSNETLSLGITLEAREARLDYKYRVIKEGDRLLFDGNLEARFSPRIQAQYSEKRKQDDGNKKDEDFFSEEIEVIQRRIDRIRIFRLGRVAVIIKGLGNLTHSLSMMINSYLNDHQEELQPTFRMIEKEAVIQVNKMFETSDVSLNINDLYS